jgi:hypothetical protein
VGGARKPARSVGVLALMLAAEVYEAQSRGPRTGAFWPRMCIPLRSPRMNTHTNTMLLRSGSLKRLRAHRLISMANTARLSMLVLIW